MLTQKYERWDVGCWVRGGLDARRVSAGSLAASGFHSFPPSLVPYAAKLEGRFGPDALHAALTQCLYGYLRFTEELELRSINLVGQQIALGQTSVQISRDLRSRAFLLVRDEAHHAAVSDQIAARIEALTGVSPGTSGEPQFLRRLHALRDRVRSEVASQLETAFATISETLISGSLALIPRDPTVLPLVRDYAGAHAVDEGRHQTYFAEFFAEWWPRLPGRVQSGLGPLLPELCMAFLEPDRNLHQQVLEGCGLSPAEAGDWLEEAWPATATATAARRPLQATLSLFGRSGVFDDAATREAFEARGLLIRE